MIQAQYDAALQNPPWENTDNFDIDDRPKKKRRVTSRWFYEVVREDGTVVDVIDQAEETQESQEPRSKSTSRSTSPLSSPLTSLPSSPPDTTTPPSTVCIPSSLFLTSWQNLLHQVQARSRTRWPRYECTSIHRTITLLSARSSSS